jgi:uncharacterized protein (DUF362 family)/Pyruvate/2-oxoacid:ferredoxin oxidoreductase delta subunit
LRIRTGIGYHSGMSAKPVVAFAFCHDYGAALGPALDRAVDAIGGWQSLVRPGLKVLVKPNLLLDRKPEEAVTTHPEFVRVVLRRLKACGAEVRVGDSPAFAVDLRRVWEKTGIQAVCAEEGVPLISLEAAGMVKVERDGHHFGISKPVAEADLVINLPKVKTHGLTVLTAAVKNFYGTVPGFLKTQLHKEHPRRPSFGKLVKAIGESMPPSLNLADGVIGMDGEGPSAGQPVKLGFVAASMDPFAMDIALCGVLHIDPAKVPYLLDMPQHAPYNAIERRGDAPDAPHFRQPVHTHLYLKHVPDCVIQFVARRVWFRPFFGNTCVACGRCAKACPMSAIAFTIGQRPVLNGPLCVGCCCCHEVCPVNAIEIQPSPMLKFLGNFIDLRKGPKKADAPQTPK